MCPRSAFLLAVAPLLLSCDQEPGSGAPPPTSGGEEQFSTDGYRIPRDLEDAVGEVVARLLALRRTGIRRVVFCDGADPGSDFLGALGGE
jgi:hypothetical protein